MLKLERQQAILDYIREHHTARVQDLSGLFFISETSIRRDLTKLERSGLIRKSYGGAVLLEGGNEVVSLEARQQTEREAKTVIAGKAAQLIANGDVIFLDSSSTALAIVPFLAGYTSLSVITNGIRIACELADLPGIKVYSLGGLVTSHTFSASGALTCRMLGDMRAGKLFVSPKAVDGSVYCANEEETAVRRMMMDRADRVYLMCSVRKFGQRAAFRLCGLNEVDAVICDETPAPAWVEALDKANAALI